MSAVRILEGAERILELLQKAKKVNRILVFKI